MAATYVDISYWYDAGVKCGATHMVVVCDSFDYEDYPVYRLPDDPETPTELVAKYNGKSMQRVMECYDLRLDKLSQMEEHRAFHTDP